MEFWKPNNAIKTEQSTAVRFYTHKAQTLLMLLEIASALILVFYSTTRLPIALKLLIDFAKQTCALLLATPSVFLIGNAIVVTLFAQFKPPTTNPSSDLYDEFVAESRNRSPIQALEIEPLRSEAGYESEVIRCCGRTQSERVVSVSDVKKKKKKELRRSRTEKCGTKAKTASCDVVDELSGDEFRRRVEAFIAKQQRFIRDENMMALVVVSS